MKYEDFQPHINTIFSVQPDNVDGLEQELALTLDDVVLTRYQDDNVIELAGRVPFSLFFRADDSILLHQGTFTLNHDVLGEQFIFIVPVEKKDGFYIYQAVFS